MSSSGFSSDDDYQRPFADQPEPAPSGDAPDSANLMDRVLEETLAATDADAALEPGEVDALKQVARRHPNEPLTLSPVATELVGAVLSTRFGHLRDKAEHWQSMSSTIAETLMDDPSSRDRLQSLWARLSEATR